MFFSVLFWGAIVGLIHFIAVGALYGNPLVDKKYQQAMKSEQGVRKWDSRPRYLITQYLGTQLEVYILTLAVFWLSPLMETTGSGKVTLLGILLAAIRVYPRFWNMWIQSTYPFQLLVIEFINGTISTFVIVLSLHFLPIGI